ncbi:T9SS type A sorting domain-containing protein [Flavobacterium sp.]|uniref:T9SS type A sorting domain-containing protein n=1 Tax=Flavobacterium sp. TaxID=239 RepID=UPI0026029264|nr:T9SS type A sorting domain-containing protein [Flavobacterium sp.]
MKKVIFTNILVFASMFGFSQISLSVGGVNVPSGTVLARTQLGYPAAEILFRVRNNGPATTNVWIKCEDLVNNNGSNFQLCFGQECLPEVSENTIYPTTGSVTLAPNASNGNFDHFLNDNAGSGTFPLDFVFRFFQTNQATQGGAEVGNAITVTYRYDPNLSVDEIDQLQSSGVIVKSTLVESELVLDVLKATTMTIVDLNGKVLHSSSLNYGIQSIDVSNFNSGVYLINFINAEGIRTSKKIIKR